MVSHAQKLNEANRIEDFVHEKPYHKPLEYPAYDYKILSQHGLFDLLS
jgi:hypothetical protein